MEQQAHNARIAICAAMRWGGRPVLRALPGAKLLRGSRPRTWSAVGRGGSVILFQTGVGMEAAAAATRSIVNAFCLDAIINTGCAGSLSPGLSVGTVVCGSPLLAEQAEQVRRYTMSCQLTAALRQAAEDAGLHPLTDAILTSPEPLLTPETKAAAFTRCAAVAVDMEGAAVAQVTSDACLELASVRVILDDASTAISAPWRQSETMFHFAKNLTGSSVSVEEVKRFSVTAQNALIVDRVLGNLFKSFLRSAV